MVQSELVTVCLTFEQRANQQSKSRFPHLCYFLPGTYPHRSWLFCLAVYALEESLHCARTARYFWTTFPLKSPQARPLETPLELGDPDWTGGDLQGDLPGSCVSQAQHKLRHMLHHWPLVGCGFSTV